MHQCIKSLYPSVYTLHYCFQCVIVKFALRLTRSLWLEIRSKLLPGALLSPPLTILGFRLTVCCTGVANPTIDSWASLMLTRDQVCPSSSWGREGVLRGASQLKVNDYVLRVI